MKCELHSRISECIVLSMVMVGSLLCAGCFSGGSASGYCEGNILHAYWTEETVNSVSETIDCSKQKLSCVEVDGYAGCVDSSLTPCDWDGFRRVDGGRTVFLCQDRLPYTKHVMNCRTGTTCMAYSNGFGCS